MPADLSLTNRRANERAYIVLGEDWDRPPGAVEQELKAARARRNMLSLNRSPLSRKIILFNLLAMVVLVAGVMYLNPFSDSLVVQRERALAVEAQLIAELFEAAIPQEAASALDAGDVDIQSILSRLSLSAGVDVFVFADPDTLVATTQTLSRSPARPVRGLDGTRQDALLITDFLNRVWSGLSRLLTSGAPEPARRDASELARALVSPTAEGLTVLSRGVDGTGTLYAAASPIFAPSGQVGAVVVTTAAGEIDHLVRVEC